MANKQKRRTVINNNKSEPEEIEFHEKTVKIYKRILKSMSWIVGVCFILVIILPLFENAFLDELTKYIFRFGILNLLAFTVMEIAADSVKQKIEKIINIPS